MKTSFGLYVLAALLLTLGCGADARVIAPGPRPDAAEASLTAAPYSDWSEVVNLGPTVNSPFNELAAEISKDGLSLYFASNRPGGFGANDIYVSRRECTDMDDPRCAWSSPTNLGPVINTAFGDAGPHLSRDGHQLFFTSGRPGGFGSNDLYVSWRANVHDDFGWEAPVNLGPPVNTSDGELGPHMRRPEFYFWRGPAVPLPPYGPGSGAPGDIYVSEMKGDVFGTPTPVAELNSPNHDEKPTVRFDGHELLFASDRPSSANEGCGVPRLPPVCDLDIWMSTRRSNGDEWSLPVNVGPPINTTADDRRSSLSPDGTMLFFDSNRPGGFGNLDLYVAKRTKGGP
jgi:WD40 repeat protein